MQIIGKDENEMLILFSPKKNLKIGDVLKVEDMLVQVIDIEFASLPGILEHLLRKSIIKKRTEEEIQESVKGFLDTLSDYKMAITKIRGTIKEDSFSHGFEELKMNRSNAQISTIHPSELLNNILGLDSNHAEVVEFTRVYKRMRAFELLSLKKFSL